MTEPWNREPTNAAVLTGDPAGGGAERFPLSPLQSWLLFQSLYRPEPAAYAEQMTCLLAGDLDAGLFDRAWQMAVDRHPAFRTAFAWEDVEEPVRIVSPRLSPKIPAKPPAAVEHREEDGESPDRLEDWLAAERQRGFDLATAPLVRALLIHVSNLGERRFRLIVTGHLLVAAGADLLALAGEALEIHGALREGRQPQLAPLRCDPREPDEPQPFDLEAAEAFWRDRLRGFTEPLVLPREQHGTGEGMGWRQAALTAPASAAVHAFAARYGLRVDTLAAGAWALLLGRWTGRSEALFGCGTLPVRCALQPAAVVTEWLAGLQAWREKARAFDQALPPHLQAWSELTPGTELFEILYTFSNVVTLPAACGLEAGEPRVLPRGGSPLFPVSLGVTAPPEGEIVLMLAYDRGRLAPPTAEWLLAQMERLLGELAAGGIEDEGRTLGEISRHSVHATESVTAGSLVHELFAAHARRDPARPALTCEGVTLSYGDLDRRADLLAARLTELGAGPDALVAVCLPRSPDLVVALLAVLKAGAAYLPLDPAYPPEHLAWVLADAGARLLVADADLAAMLAVGPSSPGPIGNHLSGTSVFVGAVRGMPKAPRVAALQEFAKSPAVPHPGRPHVVPDGIPWTAPTKTHPANLAYVIYTSGSTGHPKGVGVTHANAARLLSAAAPLFDFGPDDTWTLFHSCAFDFSVWELWGALAFGGRLVVVPFAVSRSPEAFAALLTEERVTVLNQTPSAFAQLSAHLAARSESLPSLRWVIFGGEALEPALVRGWLGAPGAARLVNMYGITETTVHVTWHELLPADLERDRTAGSPIGRPLPDLTVDLLDRDGRPVAADAEGEMYVGGAGLARGYLGRPELTAERFVPDPWSGQRGTPGARLYKSGDLARRREDGGLGYVGRADSQVKVRGFRIEPGEIEAALLAAPEVAEAAVVVREPAPGDRRLAAYVVARGGQPVPPGLAGHLRAGLRARLPKHMLPSTLTLLPALPLTVNGKTDRQALAELDPAKGTQPATAESGFVPPRTPAEEQMAEIWRLVLGVPRVGALDSFFDLGGDSILGLLVVSRAARAGWKLTPRDLFDHPTVAGIAAVATATAAPADTAAVVEAPLPPIVRAPRDQPLPLSFAQERLWFLDRLEPGRTAYNILVALRVRGALSAPACAAALAAVVRRHEALRTTFVEVDGKPVQRIAPPEDGTTPLTFVELSGLPAGRGEPEALRLAAAVGARPFDLERGPLLRAALVRPGGADAEHVLLLGLHHIITDGWSLALLVREIAETLAERTDRTERPEPLLQYADFAVWQRQWLGNRIERELAHWRALLADVPLRLELPADRPRRAAGMNDAGAEDAAGRYDTSLPAAAQARLGELARRLGVTPFMVQLAAFQVLLYRLTGQERLLVGIPVANRLQPEAEGIVGLFVNTLPLPADLRGDPPLPELLARTREVTLGAFAHSQLPFEQLVEALQPERSLEHAPVVQVMLVLQNAARPAFAAAGAGRVEVPGLSFEPLAVTAATAKLDLILDLTETSDGLAATWDYRARRFEPATIARWACGYANLLAAMSEESEPRVSELELLSPGERHQMLVEWGGTANAYPREQGLYELFAAQAAADSGAVALVTAASDATVTYGELAARAGELAARLLSLGLAPDSLVAICFERSPAMIEAILAVLQAGGAYVPLDPAQPPQRLAALLDDLATADPGRPRLLVTSSRHAGLFADFAAAGGRLVLSDEVEQNVEPAPRVPGGGDRLAYVMFTSGSTGRPKGVAVTQRGVARLVYGAGYVPFGPGETWLHMAPAAFDASTLEIWGALLHGARLVLMPPGMPTLGELEAVLARHRVTLLFLTAGLFHQMIEENLGALATVRLLMSGGEALSPPHVLRAARGLPETRLLNGYGPTESTTFTTCWLVREEGIGGSVPIGRPVSNTRILILDAAGRPAALGAAGELLIGGDGLARGYVGRPDLTAERFRPHPLATEPGDRLYHSGDLVRFLPDGCLEFLGRIDRQVKIRGFRIEPAEIEAALAALPGVGEAAVITDHGVGGELRLLGFVAGGTGGEALDPAALRAELRSRLPEAFVPAVLTVLPALPLTANGKVDRDALARLAVLRERPEDTAAGDIPGPRDPLEELVAGIWSDVLGVERVGIDDDFFDLGGHSLRATQVMSRLRQASGVELPLRLLFEAPTVAGLALRLRAALTPGESADQDTEFEAWAAIPRRAPGAALPLSYAQERLWFLDQLTPGSFVHNIPGVLVLSGDLDVAALAAAFAAVVRRHEALRTVFHAPGGEPVQVVLPPFAPPLPVIDLSALSETERAATAERLRRAEMTRGFDLARGPLLRACLLRLAAGDAIGTRHLLLLNFHHIAFDGWSINVLTRELSALYNAALARGASPLPELPVQYADFACWQRARLSGATLERVAGYWRQRLTGVPPLRLPFDRPRPPLQTFDGASRLLVLPPEVAAGVRHLARRQAVTPFMVGLAAFAVLLHRASGQDDFAVGTWVANRTRPELEGLIGFFINNLALRLDLSGNPTFDRLLAQVREVALGAYAHQDLPFEKLVEDLKLPRDLSLPPIYQVVAVQQPAAGRMDLSGLRLELPAVTTNRANVDLTLDLSDPAGDPYTAELNYNRDLFDAATLARFGHAFERLLAAALAASLATVEEVPRVDELPLLSAAEAWQIRGEWSRGLSRPAAERAAGVRFVHQLIERHAALRPEAEAVVWPEAESPERLTYGELNARANRLARVLRRHGAGPEARVALWLPRSADLVVSALAVLKAGGCYVPLDATYSGERLAFMAADAQARVLVTRGETGDFDETGAGSTVLRLDDPALAAALATESDADLSPEETGLAPENLAYVIYTSGSTGRPKGTMIEHGGLLNAYYAYEQAYRLNDVTAHLQMASFSFDVFTGDFIRALGSGARLVLCPREVLLDPERLYGLMVAERVDGAEFVPAVVRALVDHVERTSGDLAFMRLLVVSSDAWYAGEVAALARLCGPRTRLIDSYGVTEATIDTTFLPLAAGDGTPCLPVPAAAAVVPIGRPLAGNEAWVLGGVDLLPPRMPGELCIGGDGVARGYLGRPELTAEKFTPHPFSAVPGARLYRAGDLARWLPDGSVEFLGRVDSQIKVRGFRIEPGEIEAALGAHPQVSQAVVLALSGEADTAARHLVAYVVASSPVDETELRAFLKQRLPDYMVPAVFVPLAALPLTPNGKVDRRALPVPDWSRSASAAGSRHQPPRTAAEEMLAAIWREVLRVETVGAFDDFFAIGGHSLLATQVVARVRATVGVELPLRALFETPTLAELAQVIEEQLILQMDTDDEIESSS